MTEWPEDFPTSCPPEDAMESHETFYRLVGSDPATEQDFWSVKKRVDEGLQRRLPPNAETADECILVGTSVFESLETVEKVRKSGGALKRKKVAFGSLDGSGVVKKTRGPGHHTWWRPIEDQAWQNFTVDP